jgi:hypothetical protein
LAPVRPCDKELVEDDVAFRPNIERELRHRVPIPAHQILEPLLRPRVLPSPSVELLAVDLSDGTEFLKIEVH